MSVLNQTVIKHKLGLLNLAEELGYVSQTCKVMGESRDTFYRYQEAKAQGGIGPEGSPRIYDQNQIVSDLGNMHGVR